jgi:DNA adenine methylase
MRVVRATGPGEPVLATAGQLRLLPVEARPLRALGPLFRWPGGKRWLLPLLRELAPADFGRYYEPFFGGGALFLALRPAAATISDRNSALMDCYRAVRDDHAEVARILRGLPRDRDSYLKIRSTLPEDSSARAARLIYLTTLAFNGIYRVNRRGEFNVPYGGRTYDDLGNEEMLRVHAEALATVEIESGDFEAAVTGARAGDFVYLDPPYTVTHSNNGFVRYNDRIFSWSDQQRLADVAQSLGRSGCTVVVSNASHPSIVDLYPSFRVISVTRTSAMAAKAGRRGPIQELVLTNALWRSRSRHDRRGAHAQTHRWA